MPKPRILAIRGGAIGDFILTLPALRLLRETFAHCHLEILGYEHIASLARSGGPVAGATYADAVRNIEAAPMAGFFARAGNLDPSWSEYFASFQQVVSWLFDPDGIFEANVKRAGVKNYISAYTKISDETHASVQLARGLESLALYLEDDVARLTPSNLPARQNDYVTLHPGSGSAKKNWPLENWVELARSLAARGSRVMLVGGEADHAVLDVLTNELAPILPLVSRGLSLPKLAEVLALSTRHYGHDTGISHLAAAVGAPSTVIFGPTDPAIWAPRGSHVRIVHAGGGELARLKVEEVIHAD